MVIHLHIRGRINEINLDHLNWYPVENLIESAVKQVDFEDFAPSSVFTSEVSLETG